MNRKFQFFSLVLICLTIIGCRSWDDGYDDPINIRTFNTTHEENAEMQRYFRTYVNRVSDEALVGTFSNTRTARYTMKITVLDKDKENAGHRIFLKNRHGRKKTNPVHYYSYKIKIDLIDNKKDGGLVWTWEPEKWKSYPTKRQTIKWLAKYSAKRMVKSGLFRSHYLN